MGDLNFSKAESDALIAVDARAVDEAIERCLEDRSSYALSSFRLDSCGAYVATKAREFDAALRAFAAARAPKKTDSTRTRAGRAGGSLGSALRRTQEALKREVQEGEHFYVFDDVRPPTRLGSDMSVRVNYRWRASASDTWTIGAIKFSHSVAPRKDYLHPPPRRKPSAATEARRQQEEIYAEWNHLKMLALESVRNFFRDGGVAKDIPTIFPVKLDSNSRQLNNHSANFWKAQPDDDGH